MYYFKLCGWSKLCQTCVLLHGVNFESIFESNNFDFTQKDHTYVKSFSQQIDKENGSRY